MSELARVDEWIIPKKIIDAHLHTFTYQDIEKRAKSMGFQTAQHYVNEMMRRNGRKVQLPPKSIKELMDKWVHELDKNNVEKAMIMPGWNDLRVLDFVSKEYPDRFIPFVMFNPKEENALEFLEEAISKYGIKGYKLYPPLNYYHAYEEFVHPFYEMANDNNLIITYHMGISVGQMADIRYMNPADVSPVARDYTKVNFLFAHFATGFLRELLFLMYHVKNVYAESSSSNRWMEFLPYNINLNQVFEKVINASGTDHIIFGTDSTGFPRGWRHPIYQWQVSVCNQIGLNQDEIDNIFYKNIERLIS